MSVLPHIADADFIADIESREAEGVLETERPGIGYPDMILLTVEERDRLVELAFRYVDLCR